MDAVVSVRCMSMHVDGIRLIDWAGQLLALKIRTALSLCTAAPPLQTHLEIGTVEHNGTLRHGKFSSLLPDTGLAPEFTFPGSSGTQVH